MPEIKAYNRMAAVRYARAWAFSRNPMYYDFSSLGGDCTNFVSQCLYAGSGVMNYRRENGWYYISPDDRAPAWTGVEFLYTFLVNNTTRAVFAREATQDEMEIGDVIQLGNSERFYHTLLVTARGEKEIYIASHSFDALNRPLSSYDFEKARFLHIAGVYV